MDDLEEIYRLLEDSAKVNNIEDLSFYKEDFPLLGGYLYCKKTGKMDNSKKIFAKEGKIYKVTRNFIFDSEISPNHGFHDYNESDENNKYTGLDWINKYFRKPTLIELKEYLGSK